MKCVSRTYEKFYRHACEREWQDFLLNSDAINPYQKKNENKIHSIKQLYTTVPTFFRIHLMCLVCLTLFILIVNKLIWNFVFGMLTLFDEQTKKVISIFWYFFKICMNQNGTFIPTILQRGINKSKYYWRKKKNATHVKKTRLATNNIVWQILPYAIFVSVIWCETHNKYWRRWVFTFVLCTLVAMPSSFSFHWNVFHPNIVAVLQH